MAKKEDWTGEVATKVTQRSIDLLSRHQKCTDPRLRVILRSRNKCRISNRQKRDETRDKAVGIARCECTLSEREPEAMTRVAKSTSIWAVLTRRQPSQIVIPKAVKCANTVQIRSLGNATK